MSYKHNRVAEDIRREITLCIRELKDPRVKDRMLTVVRVEVSSDVSFAKVFISDLQGIDGAKEAVKALTAATGRLRRAEDALNCSPWLGWRSHTPSTVSPSPGAAKGRQPTTVTGSSPPTSRRSTV